MKVFFHADDAGATPSGARRIVGAWEAGLLDGFSVVANGLGLAPLRDALAKAPGRGARLAAHLNISDGPPLSPRGEVPLLLGGDGTFRCGFLDTWLRWLAAPAARRAAFLAQVEKEWRAQVRLVKQACAPRALRSLDGHNHVHMLPFLFPVAAKLAREEGVPGVRISREAFFLSSRPAESLRPRFLLNVAKRAVLSFCARRAAPAARERGLSFPDAQVGVLYTGAMTRDAVRAGLRAAERAGSREAEVILHLGRAEPAECRAWQGKPRAKAFFVSADRDREAEALAAVRNDV